MLRFFLGSKIGQNNSHKTLVLDLLDLFWYSILIIFYLSALVSESKTRVIEDRYIVQIFWVIVFVKIIYLLAVFVDLWFVVYRFGHDESQLVNISMKFSLSISLLFGAILFLYFAQFDKICGLLIIDLKICTAAHIEGITSLIFLVIVFTIGIIVCIPFEECCRPNITSASDRYDCSEQNKINSDKKQFGKKQSGKKQSDEKHQNDKETIQLSDITHNDNEIDESMSISRIIIHERIITDNADNIQTQTYTITT
jgi:hypothetical protein